MNYIFMYLYTATPIKLWQSWNWRTQLALYLFIWFICILMAFSLWGVWDHISGWKVRQSEVILHCCHGRLLCFGTVLANWPLLTCVSECFRVIWGGAWQRVCNERTFLLTTCPELGSGGKNTGDTSPWDRVPRSSSCRLSKAWESVSCRVVRPCSWRSECDMSWALDQQCVLRGSPNKFRIMLIMKDSLSQKVTLLSFFYL